MTGSPRGRDEAAGIRSDLAGIGVSLGWIRLERTLSHKYRPDQPREPAGQPGGGRWTSGDAGAAGSLADGTDPETTGSIGGGVGASTTQEEVVTPDGSRVLTIRVRPNNAAAWDEQHTVTAPDGERTVFEMSGRTQTIRDAATGTVLARNTLGEDGTIVPEAFVQTVRSPRILQGMIARSIEAAGALFSVLLSQNDRDKTAIFVAPASEYEPGEEEKGRAIWVGKLNQDELDRACPRNGEVKALAKEAAVRIRKSNNYRDERDFGTKVHTLIAKDINNMKDPDLVAETSYDQDNGGKAPYGAPRSLRLDVLEKSDPVTVCVYDHKTGKEGLRSPRAVSLATVVKKHFPTAQRIVIIEVGPEN